MSDRRVAPGASAGPGSIPPPASAGPGIGSSVVDAHFENIISHDVRLGPLNPTDGEGTITKHDLENIFAETGAKVAFRSRGKEKGRPQRRGAVVRGEGQKRTRVGSWSPFAFCCSFSFR